MMRITDWWNQYIIRDVRSQAGQRFQRLLYVFLLLKIIFLLPVLSDVVEYTPWTGGSGWRGLAYLPLGLAQWNIHAFLGLGSVLLLAAMVVRVNWLHALGIAWFSMCLSKMSGAIANGSDTVLNLYLVLSVGFSTLPSLIIQRLRAGPAVIPNFTLVLCQVQFALIYFVSGFDKLLSPAWRSGEAIHSIVNLEYFWNPALGFDLGPASCMVMAWLVILFEIGFAFLIWFRVCRIPLLVIGVIFHLGIIFLLALPDFGIVMIICYSLFLPAKVLRPFNGLGDQ